MSEGNSTVEYRDVPGFPGYRVGSDGSVWSCWRRKGAGRGTRSVMSHMHWHRLKPRAGAEGHLYVNPRAAEGRQVKRYVHQLVAAAFIGPCPAGMECCHFPDRDPANNRPENLRYDTRRNNLADRYVHGTMNCGERQGHAKLTEAIVREMRAEYAAGGTSYQKIAASRGVDCNTAYCAIKGRTWGHVT